MGYRIKTVADLLGVPRNTLLAWERRHNIVQPQRLDNGYRVYSEADVVRLKALKQLIDNGHRVGEAVSILHTQQRSNVTTGEDIIDGLVEEILDALLRFDRLAAEALLRRCLTIPFSRQIDEIYFPLQRHIGTLWEENALTPAEEHIVSHFVREKIQSMLIALDYGPPTGKLTLCCAYPDEEHDIALMGLAVKLALRNHRIVYIGARTPMAGLISLIHAQQPELVCISTTIPQPIERLSADAQALSDGVASLDTEVVIGGSGLPAMALPEFPKIRWAKRSSAIIH